MSLSRICSCDKVRRGEEFDPGPPHGDCEWCWLFHHHADVRANHGGAGPPVAVRARPLPVGTPTPTRIVEVGPDGLSRQRSGYAFNAGLIRYQGRLLMCYRDGWSGSNCHVAELAEDYTVKSTTPLEDLYHRHGAAYGREDPRLFVYRDRLHVSFTGVMVVRGATTTNQLYARLTDDLAVEEVFNLGYDRRREWEKNWQFFEHDGELLCVYSVSPHAVLQVIKDRAFTVAETGTEFPWAGGELRGGCPPVRRGGVYYHWFHGQTWYGGAKMYSVGAYTFEARLPFRVLSATPVPLLWADHAGYRRDPETDPNYCPVVFPAGAVLENGLWRVALGWNDRRIKIAEWSESEVAAALGDSGLSHPTKVGVVRNVVNGVRNPDPTPIPAFPPRGGPGTELTALLTDLGLTPAKHCGCADRARKMDEWGVSGCTARRNEIETWLRAESAKTGWVVKIKAACTAVRTGLVTALNPLDPAPGLLDEAIRRAVEKAAPAAPPEHPSPAV
jgi:predicted GH43/DUF377 family glycosyl hydrolase